MEKVGMVGVGAMGSALLERLKLAGVRATVYDTHPPALAAARVSGAEVAASAADVARAATLIDVVVYADQDVLNAVLGKGGVLEGVQAGSLVLLFSTILPQTAQKVAKAADERGVQVIDACMTAHPGVVREGTLSFLVGGPNESVERARPHLLQMGKQIIHMGPLGTGNVANLMRLLVTGSETLVIQEAIQIGEAGGIPYPEALEMMRQLHRGSLLERWENTFDPAGTSATPVVGGNIHDKILPLAGELALQYGLALPVLEQLVAAGQRLARAQLSV